MKRIKKEDYISEEVLKLQQEVRELTKRDRERKLAEKLVEKIPQERKQYVLDLLSKELATKDNNIK